MRAELWSLGERLRSLETKAEVREQKISMQAETIESLTRQVEAKRTFDVEVADRARALEMDRLEERVKASEARAKASEEKLEKYFVEKVSLEREIESLRERLASAPSQESRDAEFPARVARGGDKNRHGEIGQRRDEDTLRAERGVQTNSRPDASKRRGDVRAGRSRGRRERARESQTANQEEIESRRLEFQTIRSRSRTRERSTSTRALGCS